MKILFRVSSIFILLLALINPAYSQAPSKSHKSLLQNRPDLRNNFPRDIESKGSSMKKYAGESGPWSELNPKVPRVDYYGVYFKDELYGFAVGEFGAIIKTTDGGNSWLDKSYPTDKTLLRISGSDNLIVIVGTSGTIIKSTDFGENWVSVNLVNNTDIWGTFTFNDTKSFVCTKDGRLLKTSNAGETWDIDTLGYPPNYWDMKFMDTDTGFISLSAGRILKTTDSGNNWIMKNTGDLYSLYSVEILPNGNLVTAGQSGEIYYSTDFGNTFTQANVPITFIIEDLAFANNNTGIAIGQATVTNAILKTSDGGITWDLINQPMGHLNVDFISDSIGYNVGIDLKIYKTSDEGDSWEQQILNENLTSLSVTNNNEAYFLGWENLYKFSSGQFYKIKTLNSGSYGLINFITDQKGFVTSTNGDILKTEDAGLNWTKVDSNSSTSQIVTLMFSDSAIGWYLSRTYLKKSIDGGNSWHQIYTGTNFNNLYFVDSLNGWISGNGVQRTTDGGLSWDMINPSASFYQIHFIDQDTGYAVSGALYKTTDGGINWSIVPGATGTELGVVEDSMIITMDDQGNNFITRDRGNTWISYTLPVGRSLKFYDQSLGYFVGNTGLIYRYYDSTYVPVELTNFGFNIQDDQVILTWETASELNNKGFEIQKRVTGENWREIGFVAGNGTTTIPHKYTFSDYSLVDGSNYYKLKQIDYDGTITYSNILSVIFNKNYTFKLYPNHPNPFNSETTINFSLPIRSDVTLEIYNILGQKVDKVHLNNLKSGNNSINYSADNLTSGIYFYTIENRGLKITGKMLLLK